MTRRTAPALGILLASTVGALPWPADAGCAEIERFLAGKASGVVCFHADDLRVPSPPTVPVTPGNNSITTFADGTALPGLLAGFGSFTPATDLGVISNGPTPTSTAVPGIQVEGWFADDPAGEARFLLRLPDGWNGKLVVAGASGTRSEYNGDWAWSDYVLSKGYAYASQNKGVLNLFILALDSSATQPASDTSSCRLNPSSKTWVHFYDNDVLVADYPSVGSDRLKPFTQWAQYMLDTARLARGALEANFNRFPRHTYAVGTSNGGYQVRRAVEAAPDLFDGGVDWEGTFVDVRENILRRLPPAIEHFAGYIAGGCDPDGTEAKAIRAAGYPPDIVTTCTASASPTDGSFGTLWGHYSAQFWEVTQCQWQKRFDPTWVTYPGGPDDVDGTGGYNYLSRLDDGFVDVPQLSGSATTGKIKKPLITVAGTMDALLPIRKQAEAYESQVDASRKGNDAKRAAQYRLYEVQNGNHIEGYIPLFPGALELIQPHAQKAFDLLVDHVEDGASLPPSQCIPRGGSISSHPSEPGHCASLFVP
jgi:3HB-oligomer hydrolase (3HBOH)